MKMNFKKFKLVTKVSIAVAFTLIIVFIVLITCSVALSRNAVTSAIDGEFSGIATQNSIMIQNIFDSATIAAQDLQDYLENTYVGYDELLKSQQVDEEGNKIPLPTKKSSVYNVEILELNYEIENYILNTAWGIVKNNPDIIGVGAFFEPYAYDKSIKDYTIYVTANEVTNRSAQSYGQYSDYSANDYYQKAAQSKQPCFTNPYVDQGITMVTASYPILSNGELQGVILVDINVDNFSKIKTSDTDYLSMFVTIYSDDGTIVYDSESKDNTGKIFKNIISAKDYATFDSNEQTHAEFVIQITKPSGQTAISYFYPIKISGQTWWASSSLDLSDLNKDVVSLSLMMGIMSAFALLIILIVITVILKKQLKPMEGVVVAAKEIAKGNLDIKIEVNSEDEIGILSMTFLSMAENLKTIINDVDYLLGEMGAGNFQLETQHEEKYIGQYHSILSAIQKINHNLSNTLQQINQASDQVSSGSDQVSSGAQALSQGATEQASSVEELAATITEISDQVKNNAVNAQDASKIANETGDQMAQSNQRMQQMIRAMSEINGSSNEIGKIIKTIEDIAFQTNILALNAAVEAARAGSAGKGFAVVADEVRNLASKSAEASKNTANLIESSIQSVNNGTTIADETAQALLSAVEGAKIVSQTIDKISKASNEQATSIAQITLGIDQISSVVQTNSATAEESAAASEELSSQAQILKNLVNHFQLKNAPMPSVNMGQPSLTYSEYSGLPGRLKDY